MKLRLFPQETAGLQALARMSDHILAGTQTLAELLGAGRTGFTPLTQSLRKQEAESTADFATLLTNMRTSFINPLPAKTCTHWASC
ncbi:hypothetical protein NHF46_20935 [Arthrobacter alpinus]|nr:hypothetical protein [Arthrobacter alpinus]